VVKLSCTSEIKEFMARPKKQKEHLIPKPELHLSDETKKGVAVIVFIVLFFISALSLFNVL